MSEPDGSPAPNPRTRGVGFPTVPLAAAAATIRRIALHGTQHSEAAFAQYLGHNTTNSGAYRQKAAAFRDWGLITSSGGRIALTDLARRIAMADEGDEVPVLREAFRACDVFHSVYDECAKGQPVEAAWVEKRAVLQLGVAGQSASRFTESFIASAVAAGLARRTSERTFILEMPLDEEHGQNLDVAAAPVTPPRMYGGGEILSMPVTRPPVVVRQEWPVDEGSVVLEIRSSKPLPPGVFVSLGAAVTAAAEVAAALMGEHRHDIA